MAIDKMEVISDDLIDEGKGGGLKSLFKNIPLLIAGIIVMLVLAYLLVIKMIKPMFTDDPSKRMKEVEETLRPKDNPQEVIQKTNEGDEVPIEEKKPLQDIYSFPEDFMVNPALESADSESAILIVSISLEVDTKEVLVELEQRTPQLSDLIVQTLSSKPLSEIVKPETKIRLKNDLKKEFNNILINGKVVNVFFQKFQYQIM